MVMTFLANMIACGMQSSLVILELPISFAHMVTRKRPVIMFLQISNTRHISKGEQVGDLILIRLQ